MYVFGLVVHSFNQNVYVIVWYILLKFVDTVDNPYFYDLFYLFYVNNIVNNYLFVFLLTFFLKIG